MLTFIAFLLTIAGCVNWLLIGLLQYDFIAGFFGFQASIFSRLCYIAIGAGCLYLIIRIIVNKGSLKVFERKKKKENVKLANIEADTEKVPTESDNNTIKDASKKDLD